MANDLLDEAISNIRRRQPELQGMPAERAEVPRRVDETRKREPSLAGRIGRRLLMPISPKTLVGTGQELAEFVTGIPRMFGLDIEAPKVVETGLPEKLGAGAIEYLTGAGLMRGIPLIQRGIEAARRIPAIGRAITAPITQRAIGAAGLGALEQPERPVRGAMMGAAISPAVEMGFKIPGAAVNFMTKAKWSPFHYMMTPHIRREFDEFLGNMGAKHGLTMEHDIDKALYNRLEAEYGVVTDRAGELYDEAENAFKDIKYPLDWKVKLKEETSPILKKIGDPYEKATDSFGIKIRNEIKSLEDRIDNPVAFRRKIHSAERDALKTGNFDLLENLETIEKSFDQNINNLALKTKDENVSNALELLKNADDYFKKNVVPFRKRARVKLEEGKTKMIPTEFFGAHSKDTSKNLTKKIGSKIEDLEHMNKIIPEMKDFLALSHLKGGFGKPETFIQKFKALTKEQKNIYFTKEQIDRLNKFVKIYDKNPAAFREESVAAKMLSPTAAGIATGLAAALPLHHLTTPAAAAGLVGLGTLKGLSAIPAIREAYITGRPAITPTPDIIRNLVIGALLGTTR